MKTLALFSFILLIFNNLSSQEKPDTVKLFTIYAGYVITHQNDTVHGYILLKNKIANQGKVFFFNSPNDKEPAEKYKPRDIKGYKVSDRVYESMKYSPQNTTMIYSFLLKEIDGSICIYKAFFDDKERVKIDENDIWNSKIDFSFSESELKEQHVGKRRTEKELQFFDSMGYLLKFKKNMSEYLSDCPEIAGKIANKEKGYEWANLEKIIMEYNDWYSRNH